MSTAVVFETHANSEHNETAELASGESGVPILLDWRLRECDYGELNGAPRAVVHGDRVRYLDAPYPGGESWRGAVARAGHIATRWAFEQRSRGISLDDLVAEDFAWQPGWAYVVG